jgi:hypothetical protein
MSKKPTNSEVTLENTETNMETISDSRKTKFVGKISIKPFLEFKGEDMGLAKYGLVVFDNCYYQEPLACVEMNGIVRYLTGLNEFAPEVIDLPEEEKVAKIKDIRKTVAELEKKLATNVIDPNDPEFWSKVKLLKPDNSEFYSKYSIKLTNEPVPLDPNKPDDLIKIKAIEAGGFKYVAPSYEEAKKDSRYNYRFYLDREEITVSARTEIKKLKNKCLALLNELYETNFNKLFYVAKNIDLNSSQYKLNTPIDIMYDNMDRYINGEYTEKVIRKCIDTFLSTCEKSMHELKLNAMINDAIFYRVIALKGNTYVHMSSGSQLGNNKKEVYTYLFNPVNQDLTHSILREVEPHWNG